MVSCMQYFRADYWISNDRKFCDFCKCWITDNKPSVTFHENGKRHKANVAKRISEISRNSAKSEKEKQKMDQEIRKMEEAAYKAYAQDISSKADYTARSISEALESDTNTDAITLCNPSTSASYGGPPPGAQIDPLMPPIDFDAENENGPRVFSKKSKLPTPSPSTATTTVKEESLWIEAITDDGNTYYWHLKTGESVWEPPKEGYMSLKEYNRLNQIAVTQQQQKIEEDSKFFRENATEMVAKQNRERLKIFRRHDIKEEIEKEEKRETFQTEADIQGASAIGQWQPIIEKKVEHVDLELPKVDYFVPQVVSEITPEPPVKKFKEKKIESLDPEVTTGTASTFKKRKFAAKGNTRQRLDLD